MSLFIQSSAAEQIGVKPISNLWGTTGRYSSGLDVVISDGGSSRGTAEAAVATVTSQLEGIFSSTPDFCKSLIYQPSPLLLVVHCWADRLVNGDGQIICPITLRVFLWKCPCGLRQFLAAPFPDGFEKQTIFVKETIWRHSVGEYISLKEEKEQARKALLNAKDVVSLLPTGFGRCLIYQQSSTLLLLIWVADVCLW